MAAMADKNLGDMLPPLRGRVAAAVMTEVGSPRSMPAASLATQVKEILGVPAHAEANPLAALERAKALAGIEGAILVTGSLYLVGAIRSQLTRGEGAQRNER
jgi:dihydrofolate synthase/folylpolyglutamate synthase